MSLQCPKCQSERIDVRNNAKKAIGSIGTVIGCIGGVAAELKCARVGAVIGSPFGPIGTTVGGVTGAIIGGMFIGGIAGGTAGVALGEVVDENILDNYLCLDCEYTFSLHRPIFK